MFIKGFNITILLTTLLSSNFLIAETIGTNDRSINSNKVRNHDGKFSYFFKDYPSVSACGFIDGSKAGTKTISQVKNGECSPTNEQGVYKSLPSGCSLMDYINSCEKQYFNSTIGFLRSPSDFKDCEPQKVISWGEKCSSPIGGSFHNYKKNTFNTVNKNSIFGSAEFICIDGVYKFLNGNCDFRPVIAENLLDNEKERNYIDYAKNKLKSENPPSEVGDCDNGKILKQYQKKSCPITKEGKIVSYSDRVYMFECKNNKWSLFNNKGECAIDPVYDCKTNYNGKDGIVESNSNSYKDDLSVAITNNKLILNNINSRTRSSCRNNSNGLLCPLIIIDGSYNDSFSYAKSIFSKECEGVYLQQKVQCKSNTLNPFIGNCVVDDNNR